MLSRSDFGLLPGALLLAWLVLRLPTWRLPAFVLFGSTIGMAVILLHSYSVSGSFLQGSTVVKRHWSRAGRDDLHVSLIFVALPLHTDSVPHIELKRTRKDLARVLGLSVTALILSQLTQRRKETLGLVLSATMIPFGYVLLYRYDVAGLQPWYYANVFLPYSIVAASICSMKSILWRVGVVVGVCFAGFRGVSQSFVGLWTAQRGLYQAAVFLKQEHQIAPVASWNAGIIHYFSGREVINIDGLVNDDVGAYVVTDRLPIYLTLRGVRYLLDDRLMLSDLFATRGGYPYQELSKCVEKVQPVVRRAGAGLGDNVDLMTLDRQCLAGVDKTPIGVLYAAIKFLNPRGDGE